MVGKASPDYEGSCLVGSDIVWRLDERWVITTASCVTNPNRSYYLLISLYFGAARPYLEPELPFRLNLFVRWSFSLFDQDEG